ncbi:MAG: hypothetical protein ACLU4J_20040 [Butyricimonas paravirosa]
MLPPRNLRFSCGKWGNYRDHQRTPESSSTFTVNISQTWFTRPSLPDITTGNRERRHRMQAMENYRGPFMMKNNMYRPVQSYEDSYKTTRTTIYSGTTVMD